MELESLIYYGRVTSRLPGPEIPAVDPAFDNGTDSYGDNFLQGAVFPTLFETTPFAERRGPRRAGPR